ncbi:MAG: hypothetical protein ACYDEX_21995 [Mobilitalea sp.]
MKRPLGFIFLSLFLAFITVTGIAKGLHLAAEYGSLPLIIGLFYGLSAMVVAIGLWLFRPWAFPATIVFSISVLLWLFNWQYGLKGTYALPLHYFILYAIFICLLLFLLVYYIQRKLRKADKNNC